MDADAGGCEGVDQQHGDGHGPYAAGYWGDSGSFLGDRFEVHIANQPVTPFPRGIVDPVDANIDHHGAYLDHVGRDGARASDGRHQDVSQRQMRPI